jgi:hypothetical protein
VLGTTSPLSAQPDTLRATPGDRVRRTTTDGSGQFTVDGVRRDTFSERGRLPEGAVAHVPVPSILILEVQRPRTRGEGATHGAGVGFLLGAGFGILAGRSMVMTDRRTGAVMPGQGSTAERAFEGAAMFGLAGTALGMAIGSSAPGARWETVDPQTFIGLAPTAGSGLAVTVRLRTR